MKYRAEIDGLRALAVLPVILFHAGFEVFGGGFVGVDVFFVISGYLITTILMEGIEGGHFSIVDFYERRARRILPALFFVILVCIPFAWMWLLPSQMKDFSQSLVAVCLFASNVLFWKESGYFDSAAEEKPLLHTWSLAVEEQYYVIFPLFLVLVWRFGKSNVFRMIIVLAVISLLLSEWGWRNQAIANFYLAHTRAWELLAGSIAAFIAQKRGVQNNDLMALLGLAAITFSIFFYNQSTPFPSVFALVPVVGTVLLVLYADSATFVAKLLSAKPIVGIGLMSYSAYLWHQPLFAFAKVKSVNEPPVLLMLCLSVVSLLLAFVSWRYVEAPFRRKAQVSRAQIFSYSLLGLILFAGFGLQGHRTEGFRDREAMSIYKDLLYINPTSDYIRCDDHLDSQDPKLNYCLKAKPRVSSVLVGDSHASDKFAGLVRSLPERNWMLIGNSSCPPLMDVEFQSLDGTKCTERLKKMFSFLDTLKSIDTVVLSFAHMYPLNDFLAADHIKKGWSANDRILKDKIGIASNPVDVFAAGLYRTVEFLRKKGTDVVFLTDIPELEFMPEDCIAHRIPCEFRRSDVLRRQQIHRELIAGISKKFDNVRVFDSLNLFCGGHEEVCSILKEHRTLYRDSHHLSHFGSVEYGELFKAFLDQ